MRRGFLAAGGILALCLVGGRAEAEGYPPFYGYSPYFGGPAVYFTPDTDVRVATTQDGSAFGIDKRTYYYGGPFYHFQPSPVRHASHPRRHRRHTVLRTRG